MQLGSSPTTGTPRATNGASAATQRSASRRASSTRPTERNVRPQQSGRDEPSAGCGEMHAVAGGGQHGERSLEVLRLEIAVEGVGEEHDLAVAVRRCAERASRSAARNAITRASAAGCAAR